MNKAVPINRDTLPLGVQAIFDQGVRQWWVLNGMSEPVMDMIRKALREAYDLGVEDGEEAGFEKAKETVNDWNEPPDREC